MPASDQSRVSCCIAGAGPAGMMLGFLLARAGIRVAVLEKHGDFLRDFRGDTIHPSTLELMYELGILDDFLRLPHVEFVELSALVGDVRLTIADFRHVPSHCKFLAIMPQWDFLNFLAARGGRYPTFDLRMRAEVTDLIDDGGPVGGVRVITPAGPTEIRADLVVAADGRSSLLRQKAGLQVEELGAPMDVLWFRISRRADDVADTMGRFDRGRIFITINRGEHWQCGFVIPKGSIEDIRRRGLDAFHRAVAELAPFLHDRVGEIRDWDDVKLLTVRVDRLLRWHRPGLLCIGDAAHAMSPVGGVGINLAVQDAVAAANILTEPLRAGRVTDDDLARVQRRREMPTRVIQGLQLQIQRRIITPALAGARPLRPGLVLRTLASCPLLRRLPGRLVGVGVRPEHIDTAEIVSPVRI